MKKEKFIKYLKNELKNEAKTIREAYQDIAIDLDVDFEKLSDEEVIQEIQDLDAMTVYDNAYWTAGYTYALQNILRKLNSN